MEFTCTVLVLGALVYYYESRSAKRHNARLNALHEFRRSVGLNIIHHVRKGRI